MANTCSLTGTVLFWSLWFLLYRHRSRRSFAYLGMPLILLSTGRFTAHFLKVASTSWSASCLELSFSASGKGAGGFSEWERGWKRSYIVFLPKGEVASVLIHFLLPSRPESHPTIFLVCFGVAQLNWRSSVWYGAWAFLRVFVLDLQSIVNVHLGRDCARAPWVTLERDLNWAVFWTALLFRLFVIGLIVAPLWTWHSHWPSDWPLFETTAHSMKIGQCLSPPPPIDRSENVKGEIAPKSSIKNPKIIHT